MTEIQIIYDHLNGACCPEDVFGAGDDPVAAYLRLARAVHPDTHSEPIAKEAFQKLNELKQIADDRVKDGEYGKKLPLPHCIPLEIGSYKVKRTPVIGDIADLYYVEGSSQLVKVARSSDDNDLMRAEATALKVMDSITGPVRDGVPILAETFQVDGRRKRDANVISDFPGFVSAKVVRDKMQIDPRTAVWMFKRILSLLTWVHHFKLIHGAILPPHVLFYPDNDGNHQIDPRKHSVRLVDWCYSVDFTKRTRLSSWVPAWKDMYAPELLSKSYIGPESDIYMAAKTIQYLVGSALPKQLAEVLDKCLESDPQKRFKSAADAFNGWVRAAKAEYGSPTWVDFNIPR